MCTYLGSCAPVHMNKPCLSAEEDGRHVAGTVRSEHKKVVPFPLTQVFARAEVRLLSMAHHDLASVGHPSSSAARNPSSSRCIFTKEKISTPESKIENEIIVVVFHQTVIKPSPC